MKKFIKNSTLFIVGGLIYGMIETISRGYTHYTMIVLGGVCFLLIGLLNECLEWELSFTSQMVIGATLITSLEFISGCIINIWLGLAIWDYSCEPYNLLGQICAKNSFYWFLLSGVAIVLDDYLRYWLFKEEKPRYYL